jgi:hypothetical protein
MLQAGLAGGRPPGGAGYVTYCFKIPQRRRMVLIWRPPFLIRQTDHDDENENRAACAVLLTSFVLAPAGARTGKAAKPKQTSSAKAKPSAKAKAG